MKRLALFAALALAFLATLPTTAAPASNWRGLNEDLAPVNVKLAADVQLFGSKYAAVRADGQAILFAAPYDFGGMKAGTEALDKDSAALQGALHSIVKDARAGIAVLDSYAPERCSRHFTALEYAMFASWADGAQATLDNRDNYSVNAAIWLGGFNPTDLTRLDAGGPIDLEWNRVRCAGAAPSAAPSPSAS